MPAPKVGTNRRDDMLQTEAIVRSGRPAQEGFNLCHLHSLQLTRILIYPEKLQKRAKPDHMPLDRGLRQTASFTKISRKSRNLHFRWALGWSFAIWNEVTIIEKPR